ncbi:MAG: glycoside hydrolase family 3 C-terminal domain-containing protein [Clostridia bacterium]|nr:glycoside hydrolase family 3 C-terminal domain-containing protein [Clostridia bacterium]
MLANERLIFKMSLEQKVKLLTSTNLYENSSNENYEFPVFRLTRKPLEGSAGVFATQFPSDRALASCWNSALVTEVYAKHGEEVATVKKYPYFNVTDCLSAENISEDYFLTASTLGSKAKGLARARQFVNFEEFVPAQGEEPAVKNLQAVISDSPLRSVYLKSPENIDNYKAQQNDGCLFYGVAGSVEEALRYFFNGCTLVFLKDNFTEELISKLKHLTVEYRSAYTDYRAKEITLSQLDALCQSLEVFDEELLDKACDRIISALLEMRKRGQESLTVKTALNPNHVATFDEVSDDALSVTAARQSVVLIKNSGVLPLSNTAKVAVLGESAKDFTYQAEYYSGKPTADRLPFYSINNYEINTTGFASGYAKGEGARRDLIDIAVDLGKEADVALVYLSAEKGEKTLPEGQLELIEELGKNHVQIIAVVSSDGVLDLAFAQKCAAVLLTHRGGQGTTPAVLDIIKGIATPSGRLTQTVPMNVENTQHYTVIPRNEVRYPFGYGLSYTKFEYSNLKINGRGISCTVKNVGDCDGFAVPQFYVQKFRSSGIFKDKILRGFAKVYVKRNDSARVEIPFDENTFKVYDSKTGLYRIEGGEYTVKISENYFDDRLVGSIKLSEYVFKEHYKGELVESVSSSDGTKVKFDVNQEPPEVRKAKKQLPFGLKLFVAILITLYYEGVMAALAFTDIIAGKDLISYLVIGGLAVVCLALFITYVAIIAKRRKKQHYVPVNDVLSDLVENVKEFDQISKVTYIEPVEEEPEEEEDFTVMAAEEVQTEKSYDLSIEEDEEVDVTDKITFNEICGNFQAYAQSKGVVVDITSVRALFAAIGASKIIIVTTKNTDVMPDFLEALNGYFNSRELTVAGSAWKSLNDLVWKQQYDKFVLSDFANTVYSATKSPDRLYGAVIDGVDAETLLSWFAPFVTYANHPTEEHNVTFNEELSVRLPDNIFYVLSPAEGLGDKFPREVADAALQLDLVLSKTEESGEYIEADVISKNALLDLVKEARENYYLSERIWKKVDELFETVRATEKFRLGNKNTLQLEKFTSVLLECGGDEAECITDIFLAKIVPLLKLTKTYAQDGGDKTVFGIVEKLFNEEELTKIQRALNKPV